MTSARQTILDIAIVLVAVLAVFGYYYFNGISIWNAASSPSASTIPYELRSIIDGNSTMTLPYITSYPNAAVVKEVNRQVDEISQNTSCINGSTDAQLRDELLNRVPSRSLTKAQIDRMTRADVVKALDWGSEVDTSDIYAKNGIFSFKYSYSENCGGAHEYFSNQGVTFDMRTGKNIGSKDMFKNFDADKDAIQNVLLQAYQAELEKLSTDPQTGVDDTTCLDAVAYPDAFKYSQFYVSSTSQLIMTPDFAYAAQACANDTPVSIDALRPYLPQDSPLLHLSVTR